VYRIALVLTLSLNLVLVTFITEFILSGPGLEDATWFLGPALGLVFGYTQRPHSAVRLFWVLPTAGFAYLFERDLMGFGLSHTLDEFFLSSRLDMGSLPKYLVTLPVWTCVSCSAFYELASRLAKARSKGAPLA
jgi:hypothetical protein